MNAFVDLTEFLASPHRTGIQRVAGELCRWWPAECTLTPVKLIQGQRFVAMPPETLGLIRHYFEASGASVANLERRLSELSNQAESSADIVEFTAGHRVLVPEVFYDPRRVAFFRNLPAEQLNRFYFIIFDLLPFTHPEFFSADQPHETINGYTRVIRMARNVAFISKSTRDAYYGRLLRNTSSQGPVLRLGSDGLGPRPGSPPLRYPHPKFTVLGTIEPRKNHALILEAFEPLFRAIEGLRLVFLGKMGWVDSAFGEKVRWMASGGCLGFEYYPSASDDLIRQNLQDSWATIYVSVAEGFGLPPVESLWLGTPVIASGVVPSLEAIGSAGVHVVQPLDALNLRRAVLAFTESSRARAKSDEALGLSLPTWQAFANQVSKWCG